MIRVLFLRPRPDKFMAGKTRLAHTDLKLGIKAESLKDLFANAQSLVDKIPEGARFNVFYTLADQDESSENLREFVSQSVIPIDIDGVKDEQRAEIVSIILSKLGLDYTKTGIVFTGHGVHILIDTGIPWTDPLYFEATRSNYKNLTDTLSNELKKNNIDVKLDTAVWDKARILRMPFTINRKDHKGLPDCQCILMQSNIEPQDFELSKFSMPADGSININDVKRITNIEKEGVLSCPFLQWCKDNQESVEEPQWFAMLGILAFIPEEGEALCHRYSENHPNYTPNDTDNKIRQALKASGPRLCKSISMLWEGCNSCSIRAERNIATPFQIHTDEYVATQDSGFYTVLETKNGPKYIPDYEGMAKYFKQKHNYITCQDTEQVHTYDKMTGSWSLVPTTVIESFAKDHFIPSGKSAQWAEFRSWITRSELHPLEFFSKTRTNGKMNLANGVYDVSSGTLMDHAPEYGFTSMVPVPFNPTATCPRFDKFMQEVTCDDKDMENIILEYLGYVVGNVPCEQFEKCLILTGVGSNGKSVLLDVLKHIIGADNYGSVRLSDLTDAQQRFSLIGKLANIPSEETSKGFKDPAIIKAMVSGESVQVKQLYCQPFSTRVEAKHIVACNAVPDSGDNSDGLHRRMLIIPFNAKFSHELGNIDIRIRDKLLPEASGILNRIIEGYKRLITNGGFSESKVVEATATEYRMSSDPIFTWIDENFVKLDGLEARNSRTSLELLHRAYCSWCEERKFFLSNYIKFCKTVRIHFKEKNFVRDRDEKGRRITYLKGWAYVGETTGF